MKIYAMTLRRAKERGDYIQAHLDSLKLQYELVDCIDFKDYSPEAYGAFYDPKAVEQNPYLTMGVIGCTLSHLKIYELMVAQQQPYAMIIEDDVILPPDIASILNLIEKEISDGDLTMISYHNRYDKEFLLSNQEKKRIRKDLELVYPVNLDEIASTMAYVITLSAAKKILALNRPVTLSCDYWGDFNRLGAFNDVRCLYPMLVMPAQFRTTIDYPMTKTLKSKAAALVRRHRIPGLYQYLVKRSSKAIEEKYKFRFTNDKPLWLKRGAASA